MISFSLTATRLLHRSSTWKKPPSAGSRVGGYSLCRSTGPSGGRRAGAGILSVPRHLDVHGGAHEVERHRLALVVELEGEPHGRHVRPHGRGQVPLKRREQRADLTGRDPV